MAKTVATARKITGGRVPRKVQEKPGPPPVNISPDESMAVDESTAVVRAPKVHKQQVSKVVL